MRILPVLAALAMVSSAAAPFAARAADKDTTNKFYGIVEHVSVNNVKVTDDKSHKTLGFILTPKFDQLFSADGKTTYQMKDLRAGEYVEVVYDQKLLGARHADRIFILRNNNTLKNKQIPSHIKRH